MGLRWAVDHRASGRMRHSAGTQLHWQRVAKKIMPRQHPPSLRQGPIINPSATRY